MLEETIGHTESKIEQLNSYKLELISSLENIDKKLSEYQFTNSSFDFCVFKGAEVQSICDNQNLSLINNRENFYLSLFYHDYTNSMNNSLFDETISTEVDEIYNDLIESISVTDILLNEAEGFNHNVDMLKEINRIYNNSRALLKTQGSGVNTGVPSEKNIIIGKVHEDIYNEYFQSVGIRNINYQDTLDSENSQKLGILSIKSHFPSFFIQNLVIDEQSIKKLSEDDKEKYFTNIEHSNYKISPVANDNIINQLDSEYASAAVLLLLNNIISISDSKFYHGKLRISSDFEELVEYLCTADAVELDIERNRIQKNIDNWSENEQNDFIEKVSEFFAINKILIDKNKHYFETFLLGDLSLSDSNYETVELLLK